MDFFWYHLVFYSNIYFFNIHLGSKLKNPFWYNKKVFIWRISSWFIWYFFFKTSFWFWEPSRQTYRGSLSFKRSMSCLFNWFFWLLCGVILYGLTWHYLIFFGILSFWYHALTCSYLSCWWYFLLYLHELYFSFDIMFIWYLLSLLLPSFW